jgi:hypothetical protein
MIDNSRPLYGANLSQDFCQADATADTVKIYLVRRDVARHVSADGPHVFGAKQTFQFGAPDCRLPTQNKEAFVLHDYLYFTGFLLMLEWSRQIMSYNAT